VECVLGYGLTFGFVASMVVAVGIVVVEMISIFAPNGAVILMDIIGIIASLISITFVGI